jgi:hypothetical protein
MKMLRLPIILAAMAVLSPQASLAAAVPSKLSGVIVMSCVTTAAGAKIDEEIYKIDFVKKQVNNEPVIFEISDITLGWTGFFEEPSPFGPVKIPKLTKGARILINRYSGKLDDLNEVKSRELTFCRVAGARKF